MAIDPSIYNRVDTQFGLKLADLFNPASIAQRQSAADEQNMGNQLRQMQVLQGVEQMRRAPVLAQREEQQFQAQQAEAMRRQQEQARRQAMIDSLPEEQRRLIDFGVSPEKVLMPKELSPADVLAREKFEWEKRQPRGGDAVNWQTVTAADGSMVQVHPRTGAIRQLGIKGAQKTGKQLTEGQAKATTFASQMAAASNELDKIEQTGFDPSSATTQLQTSIAGGIGNIFASPQAQKAKQTQNQWSEAFLRVKTGAAATQPEVELNNKTFFPQVGDSKEVIAQKREMRAQAERDVLNMAGEGRELATPRSPASPSMAGSYDAGKEARYQAWKAQQGR